MDLLRQPYPRNETPGHAWRLALFFGLFVGLFLWLFQPFGLATWQTAHKSLKIWGYGLITFGITAFCNGVVPRLIPRPFAEERWTVGKEIAQILLHIVLISVANWLYIAWLTNNYVTEGFGWSLAVTLLVGIFPVAGAVVANYIRQLKRYQQQAATLSAKLPPHPTADAPAPPVVTSATKPAGPSATSSETRITLVAENEKDTFTIPTADLLAIESSDNYCTIFFVRKQTLAKELMRSSLSRLESQLTNSPGLTDTNHFVRCHRSYVVNLEQVERISGNAQGYKLHLLNGQLTVPVARKYNDTLIAQLGQQV
ncbi:LytTR family transcriptional regulator [Fibrella sp. HMF5335]|uniref:LytTR family transcriptional regulator n=1 Tax=Fibrella rubiginis TaxID=2817060 RepID=A0A939JZL0_9BACT|nr:LytTR family DNA-binding domain-containing protein [Fibrella rubiginis]MBO0935167.1 LytTR family transcriptional regulator [Fibrella rubiginis]